MYVSGHHSSAVLHATHHARLGQAGKDFMCVGVWFRGAGREPDITRTVLYIHILKKEGKKERRKKGRRKGRGER